jgi:hypothetical protein
LQVESDGGRIQIGDWLSTLAVQGSYVQSGAQRRFTATTNGGAMYASGVFFPTTLATT